MRNWQAIPHSEGATGSRHVGEGADKSCAVPTWILVLCVLLAVIPSCCIGQGAQCAKEIDNSDRSSPIRACAASDADPSPNSSDVDRLARAIYAAGKIAPSGDRCFGGKDGHAANSVRGRILAANGEVLASSVSRKIVVADPRLVASLDLPASVLSAIVRKTAEVLDLDEGLIREKFARDTHYSVLAKDVRPEEFQRLEAEIGRLDFGIEEKKLTAKELIAIAQARRKAIYADKEDAWLRVHPHGVLAAHVLGYVDAEGKGMDGIERQFDEALRAGLDVRLAIDVFAQETLEGELERAMHTWDPNSVCGIVMRPRTGEIVAMAVRPAFDPDAPLKASGADSAQAAMSALRNRCITDIAEPGSIFGIVPLSAAMNEGLLRLETRTFCENGSFVFGGSRVHDNAPWGELTVQEIVAKSSSIGFAKSGIRLGQDRLHEYIRAFGFGQLTGVDLPGEVAGIVHPPSKWSAMSIARVPMGYEVAVTPLQVGVMMSVFGNHGQLMKPVVVAALLDREGHVVERLAPATARRVISPETESRVIAVLVATAAPGGTNAVPAGASRGRMVERIPAGTVRRVVSPETASDMLEALTAAVRTGGTAAKAAVEGYDVAAKTGTAQKFDPGQGGYGHRYHLTFAGLIPARAPELCICLAMDEPDESSGGPYAGIVLAPVFRSVAERLAKHFGIR